MIHNKKVAKNKLVGVSTILGNKSFLAATDIDKIALLLYVRDLF